MAQIFHPSFNTLSKVSIFGALFFLAGAGWVVAKWVRSSYATNQQVAIDQPIQFSHQHHAGALGIDCRYCHGGVEDSAFAGLPPTKTCMNCHSQIWAGSPFLEPVRESYRTGRSIRWNRVHNLADFCYFDHSVHVAKGVGCSTCHGRVDQMQLVWQENSLLMEWCLNCHRAPERYVRPRDQVFNMDWEPPPDQVERGLELLQQYGVQRRTDCSTCHR